MVAAMAAMVAMVAKVAKVAMVAMVAKAEGERVLEAVVATPLAVDTLG